ncbi:MAG: undecaprenyl-diphosphate phosphatase [Oscillospiraceae bacterium]|nr:undecaprenyl-diphosphate phosphatase [Oscillospiraceae bacterium]
MTVFEAIIQGIVQGLTEFLPVSSSGHLALASYFFGTSGEETVILMLVLHLGTLVAVFAAFREKIKALIIEAFAMVKALFTGQFKWKEMNLERRMLMMVIISILPLFGFYIFKDFFIGLASGGNMIIVGVAFLYTSALLFLSTKAKEGNRLAGETTVKAALFIGVFQGIALIPGISRSGSTISAGLLSGLKRKEAVEYSFILGIPVILAGAVVELKGLGESAADLNIVALLIGFITAAVVGYLSIKLVKYLVATDRFRIFAYYTLALGVLTICLGVYDKVNS